MGKNWIQVSLRRATHVRLRALGRELARQCSEGQLDGSRIRLHGLSLDAVIDYLLIAHDGLRRVSSGPGRDQGEPISEKGE